VKAKQLFISLILGLGLILALLWLLGGSTPSAHAGSPHYVAPDCTGVSAPCHTSIQEAVDAAVPGDEILVAGGTYTGVSARAGVTQVVYISKTITIHGGYTTTNWTTPYPITQPTTLDAQGQGRVLYITGDISPTIEGLRITGGNAIGLGGALGYDAGGGVYVISATATVSNNQVFSNTSYDGGGMYLLSSDATLMGNTFTDNAAGGELGHGGGMYLLSSDATLMGNTFTDNAAGGELGDGGGLYLLASDATLISNSFTANATGELGVGGGLCLLAGDATLNNNTFISNTAHGGGGLVLAYSAATLHGNTIAYNTADGGGGLDLFASNATLSNNIVISNTAYFWGGGLYVDQSSNATLVNNVVADNRADSQGSGLYILGSSPRLLHNTIARNTGGDGSGVYVTNFGADYGTVAFTNTILVSHTVGITVTGGNTATLEATLWANDTDWGGVGNIFTGTINIWGAPAFVDPDSGDYHIGATSAAIDKGVNAGVTTDIDSDARPDGCFFDMGADEFMTGVACKYMYLPVIMRQYQ
jgi:parallel beta-helix repeat protein